MATHYWWHLKIQKFTLISCCWSSLTLEPGLELISMERAFSFEWGPRDVIFCKYYSSTFSFEIVASGEHHPVFLFHYLSEKITIILIWKCSSLSSYFSLVICDGNQTESSTIQRVIMQVLWNYKLNSTTFTPITNIYTLQQHILLQLIVIVHVHK